MSRLRQEDNVFGESHVDEIAQQYGIPVLAKLPINSDLAKLCDNGTIELFEGDWLESAADKIEAAEKKA